MGVRYSSPTTMHGAILCEFRRYLRETYDRNAWDEVHERADVGGQLLVPVTEYPDPYYYELVEAATTVIDPDQSAIEHGFGRALVQAHLADDESGTGERRSVIERLTSVGEWVRRSFEPNGTASSPLAFTVDRSGERRVRLTYGSPLGLCTVVEGMIAEIAETAKADWTVEEDRCMHDGATECEFVIDTCPGSPVPASTRRPPEAMD